jgi:hypothetical protein
MLALALSAVGCGASTGDLSGRVLRKDGTPLPGGVLTFYPEERGNPVSVVIQADGSYEAKGVPAGQAKISVDNRILDPKAKASGVVAKAIQPPKEALEKMKQEGKSTPIGFGANKGAPPGKYVPIDRAFARPETSGLKAQVEGGPQRLDVQLPK